MYIEIISVIFLFLDSLLSCLVACQSILVKIIAQKRRGTGGVSRFRGDEKAS